MVLSDAVHAKRLDHIKVAVLGNPGLIAIPIGVRPGMSAIATHMLDKKMEQTDIPDLPEIKELIADTRRGM